VPFRTEKMLALGTLRRIKSFMRQIRTVTTRLLLLLSDQAAGGRSASPPGLMVDRTVVPHRMGH